MWILTKEKPGIVQGTIKEIIENKPNKKVRPNAMIVRQKTKTRIFRNIPESYIPSHSFDQEFNNSFLHILGMDERMDESGDKVIYDFWPIESEPAEEGSMPTDLYMAENCAEEVAEVYGISQPMIERIKLGIFFGLCVGILIVIFLIVGSAGGR